MRRFGSAQSTGDSHQRVEKQIALIKEHDSPWTFSLVQMVMVDSKRIQFYFMVVAFFAEYCRMISCLVGILANLIASKKMKNPFRNQEIELYF